MTTPGLDRDAHLGGFSAIFGDGRGWRLGLDGPEFESLATEEASIREAEEEALNREAGITTPKLLAEQADFRQKSEADPFDAWRGWE